MLKIELSNLPFYEVIKKLRESDSKDLVFSVSSDCPFLENLLSFKILKAEAKRLGIKFAFVAEDKNVSSLVEALNEDGETFGFVKGYDVAIQQEEETSGALAQPSRKPFPLSSIRIPIKLHLPISRDVAFITVILLGLLGVFIYVFFYRIPKASVTLSLNAEALAKPIDVVASPSAQSFEAKARVIPALEISVVSKKSGLVQATGTKEVGEKARGTVTIYNKTDSSKTFPARTPIYKGRTQGKDLTYLTDSELMVSGQSSGISGVATVSATAEKIGTEYNISGSTLTVASLPTGSFIAETIGGFAGGSKRSVTVVTDADQKKLLATTKADLDNSLSSDIRGKLAPDQKMDDSSINYTTTSKSFDKEVGEEATSFKLDLEEKASVLVYTESSLKDLLKEVLKEYVPDGYEVFPRDEEVEVLSLKYNKGNLFLTTKVRGFIVPKVDTDKIRSDIAGMTLQDAKKYIGGIAKITSFNIIVSPQVPGFTFMPRNKQAINIEVTRK